MLVESQALNKYDSIGRFGLKKVETRLRDLIVLGSHV